MNTSAEGKIAELPDPEVEIFAMIKCTSPHKEIEGPDFRL
jgi:hypothetical protein